MISFLDQLPFFRKMSLFLKYYKLVTLTWAGPKGKIGFEKNSQHFYPILPGN